MADDKLRIVATVEDQFTGPLGKLEKSIKRVGDETSKQGATWKKDWAGVRDEVGKFQGVLRGFDPIFSAVGVTGFGAAMSITGMVSALRGFSGSTQQLSMLSRETGVAVDKLRAFGALGERFGVSADSMKSSVASFATSMFDLRRRWGEAYSGLQAMNLGKLAEDLVNAPNMDEALKRAVDGIQAIPEPEVRRRVSRMLFGTDDIARIAGSMTGKFSEALAQVQKEVGHLDKQTEEAAARFEQSMGRIGAAAERLKLKVLGPMLKGTADIIEDAEKNGLSGNDDQRAIRNQISPFGGPEATPREKLEGRRTQVEQQLKLLDAGPRGADYQRKHDRMIEELKRVADELQKVRENGGASVSPSSFGGTTGGGSLIQKAAWGGGPLSGASAGAATPGYGGGGGAGRGGSGGGGAAPAAPVPHGSQIDHAMPDLGEGIHGRPFGSKGDGVAIPSRDAGANPGAYKAVLDHIADSEGTINRPKASGYNTSLGYGRFLPGGQEQNLTGMTLDQISALGRYMRRQPGNPNSSALGRYQIVGDTMRRLMKRMGLKGNELFDEKMQDRMGAELARDTGGSPARLRREWASLVGWRNAKAAQLFGEVGRNASTTPEDRPVATGPLSDATGPLPQPKHEVPEAEGAPEPTDGRGVNADLMKVLKRAQALSKVKFHVHEGLRTLERQREMVRRGWSKTMDSEHLKGRAVDVRADGDPAVGGLDRKKYEEINRAMRQASEEAGIPVEWGGDWKKFKDIPHFQFPKGYRARSGAYAGDPPPGKTRADEGPGSTLPGDRPDKRGTLHIKFENAPAGMTHRADTAGLFRETTVSKGRSQMDMDRA